MPLPSGTMEPKSTKQTPIKKAHPTTQQLWDEPTDDEYRYFIEEYPIMKAMEPRISLA